MEKTKELVIILVLIGLLAYLPSLFGGFLWDDEDFVTKNAYVKELRISRFFTENAIAGAGKTSNYYRPLQFSLYSLLYRLAGPSPVLFHSASLLLHTAAAILAFLWLLRITGKRRFAFLASLLFLLHPVQTESVSYISGISDPLYAAFFFASLLLFADRRTGWWRLPLSLILFACALMSKELAVILPVVLVLQTVLIDKNNVREEYKYWLMYGSVSIAYLVMRFTVLQFMDIRTAWGTHPYAQHLATRIATFFHSFFTYVSLIVFPHTLHMERDYTVAVHASLWNTWTLMFFLANGAVLFLLFLKNARKAAFFYLAFLVSLTPYAGIFLLNGIFYEHYLYLPILFFSGFLLSLAGSLVKKNAFTVAFSCLLVLLAVRSYARQWDWVDAERFYRQTLRYAPESVRITNGLGMVLAEKGRCPEALEYYEHALSLNPRTPPALHNSAICYAAMGNLKKAEEYLNKNISQAPDFHYSYFTLLELYVKSGQKSKAKTLLENVMLRKFPGDPELQTIYGSL